MSGGRCDDALTNLYQYLDRELDSLNAERIRLHLDECSGCLDIYNFEERLKVVIRERLAEDVPGEFIDRIRQVISQDTAFEA